MDAALSRIQMATEQLTGICGELDRLTRRIESIRTAVLHAAATTIVAVNQRSLAPAAVRRRLPPVPPLTTNSEIIARVKAALKLNTKKEAEIVAAAVVDALEDTLIKHLGDDGFSIKLGRFGKFSIRNRPGSYRRIPLTGETRMTSTQRKVKFVAIGRLRKLERVGSDS